MFWECSEVTLETRLNSATTTVSLPSRERILKAIEASPSFLSDITNEPLAQKVAELSIEEQQRMLYVLLERFIETSEITSPENREVQANGNLADDVSEIVEADALNS